MLNRLIILVIAGFMATVFADEVAPASSEDGKEYSTRVSNIAEEYGVTEDSVQALKERFSIGYGGISKAFALSAKSGLSSEEILAMKTEGKMGWGSIARSLELLPGKDYRLSDMESGTSDARMRAMERKMNQKVDRAERKGGRDR